MITTLTHYQQITAQCRALFLQKMTDYGVAWRILRLPSLTDQIFIKAQRIRSIQSLAEQKVEERQESEFIGIINYYIMALIQLEKGIAEQPDLTNDEATALYDKHPVHVQHEMPQRQAAEARRTHWPSRTNLTKHRHAPNWICMCFAKPSKNHVYV